MSSRRDRTYTAKGFLATAGFAALWRGRPMRSEEIHTDLAIAAAALARQGRAEVDDHGSIVGIHGLTLRSTRHRFEIDGLARHTWCAFDAVGIPAALGLDAVAHSDCPACGASFHCGKDEARCWCVDLPALKPVPGLGCLCRACLEAAVKERSAPDPRS